VGKVGEKLHGVVRNPGVGSFGARDGREGLLRGEQWPAAVFGSGGGGAAGLGGDEWVKEHRWRSVVLAAGSDGCEEVWRRGLRGDLEGGGGHGGGGGRSRQQGLAGRGARAQEGRRTSRERPGASREDSRRVKAREGAWRGRPGLHGVAVAPRRQSSACAHGVAPRGEAERVAVAGLGEPGGGEATWPGGRRAAGGSAQPGARQGRGEREQRG